MKTFLVVLALGALETWGWMEFRASRMHSNRSEPVKIVAPAPKKEKVSFHVPRNNYTMVF